MRDKCYEVDMTRFVPRGYKNGVTRMELVGMTGMPDRTVRQAIEWTSDNIDLIFSYGGTYFRWSDADDDLYALDYCDKEESRLKSESHKLKRYRKFAKERRAVRDGQLNLLFGKGEKC